MNLLRQRLLTINETRLLLPLLSQPEAKPKGTKSHATAYYNETDPVGPMQPEQNGPYSQED
jgi:hypothetical protein